MTTDIPYTTVTITTEWTCDNCDEDMEQTDEAVDQDQIIMCTNCNARFRALIR